MASSLASLNLDSDTLWGSTLVNTFMGWPPTAPPPPHRDIQFGTPRDLVVGGNELCSSLAGLSLTPHRPHSHLELPSHLPIQPPPPFSHPRTTHNTSEPAVHPPPFSPPSLFSSPRAIRTTATPAQPLRISAPLQSSVGAGRSDFLIPASSPSDSTTSSRNMHRINRRRLRLYRSRRTVVYRPLDRAEIADPPPAYAAIDPLQPKPKLRSYPRESERVNWRDGFRFHWQGLGLGKLNMNWNLRYFRNGYRRLDRGFKITEARGFRESVRRVKNGLGRNVGKAKGMVGDVSGAAPREWKRWRIVRARRKLGWLKRNGFLSDQERVLVRELRG
ncbi:hypothetical protein K458DRAFT_396254 [Lentithecium fluviatile CBS 122367]|uniref:Uncharacterized protein n=1 Tax=Lentithecium fluviatile CBS 122367 TaxID=1168545 RepID=A0A6G1IGR4_9PLEO|nr:hypothetical protein K458DRAFT_396254 [Lentithecium fluviatile CBS 122367]